MGIKERIEEIKIDYYVTLCFWISKQKVELNSTKQKIIAGEKFDCRFSFSPVKIMIKSNMKNINFFNFPPFSQQANGE